MQALILCDKVIDQVKVCIVPLFKSVKHISWRKSRKFQTVIKLDLKNSRQLFSLEIIIIIIIIIIKLRYPELVSHHVNGHDRNHNISAEEKE